jgi:hypothetical protein
MLWAGAGAGLIAGKREAYLAIDNARVAFATGIVRKFCRPFCGDGGIDRECKLSFMLC